MTKVKDLNSPVIKKKLSRQEITNLAEGQWESCNSCDENDKYFWINGFIHGYNLLQHDR